VNFLITLLPKLLTLLEEKKGSKGHGRNAARLAGVGGTAITIAMLTSIMGEQKSQRELWASVDKRLVRVETVLSIPKSDAPAVTGSGLVTPAASPGESNRFVFLHKGNQ